MIVHFNIGKNPLPLRGLPFIHFFLASESGYWIGIKFGEVDPLYWIKVFIFTLTRYMEVNTDLSAMQACLLRSKALQGA
jgi:hypothetical protein